MLKNWKVLTAIALALAVFFGIYQKGKVDGTNYVQSKWDAEKIKQQAAENARLEREQKELKQLSNSLINAANSIKENTTNAKIEYIKTVERVPIHNECVIDNERLRTLEDAAETANKNIASAIRPANARN